MSQKSPERKSEPILISKLMEKYDIPNVIKKKSDAVKYIKAGNATFTLESTKLDKRYTYKIMHKRKDNCLERLIVYRLYGPDNENDYRFLGILYKDTMTFKVQPNQIKSTEVIMLTAFINIITSEDKPWPETCKFYKSGKCAVCGRKLTTPESIDIGVGPHCLVYLDQ